MTVTIQAQITRLLELGQLTIVQVIAQAIHNTFTLVKMVIL